MKTVLIEAETEPFVEIIFTFSFAAIFFLDLR